MSLTNIYRTTHCELQMFTGFWLVSSHFDVEQFNVILTGIIHYIHIKFAMAYIMIYKVVIWLIDGLVFNTNFSNISATSWHE